MECNGGASQADTKKGVVFGRKLLPFLYRNAGVECEEGVQPPPHERGSKGKHGAQRMCVPWQVKRLRSDLVRLKETRQRFSTVYLHIFIECDIFHCEEDTLCTLASGRKVSPEQYLERKDGA